MPDDASILLPLAAFVLLGFTTQSMVGFGSNLLILSLGVNLLPIAELVPLMVSLGVVQTTVILVRHPDQIDRSLLLKRILPLAALGVAIGAGFVSSRVEGPLLRRVFGGLVSLYAGFEIVRTLRAAAEEEARPLPWPLFGVGTLAAGVVQGIYATGGPLLVAVVGRLGLDKEVFRTTLIAVWWLLNVGLVSFFAFEGRLDATVGIRIAWLLPAVALGLLLGEWAHSRVDRRRFWLLIHLILVGAGLALLR